ncbi:hypothetical protein BRE01_05120 [Brevibacillus reuszeri]|uniref:DUF4025 domain-containing protein n=1 Tax=Brevibacillus reuszeri TaxID=54915 RepID=A0A0K9YQE8_9BACL|nr:YozQ family protein [Brevibacillus reuszeri]KNB70954.1 hypothetical protein ADS79_19155 [Brevibacillus reuszeri]MED1857362.1 YozQ family protein [Brevibacillus reuszeri]GED66810.1 hypothetical protein BRE01_05120 [Brevibacillus reuszeri]
MKNSNDQTLREASQEVADKMYDSSFEKSSSQMEKGLASTHEQVSDTFMQGTSDESLDPEEE